MRIADVDAFAKPRKEWVERERKKNHNEEYRRGYLEGAKVLLFELKSEMFASTVDAEPVRHGNLVHLGGDEWCCSNCGDVIFTEGSWEAPTSKYCSNCGADMRGE